MDDQPLYIPPKPTDENHNGQEYIGAQLRVISEYEEIIIHDENHVTRSGPTYTLEEIKSAIRLATGNRAEAARILRVSYYKFREWLDLYPELSEELDLAKDLILDDAEYKLQQHIHDLNNFQALKFFLQTLGRDRGYGNRKDSLNVNLDLSKMTDEQLARIARGESPEDVIRNK